MKNIEYYINLDDKTTPNRKKDNEKSLQLKKINTKKNTSFFHPPATQ